MVVGDAEEGAVDALGGGGQGGDVGQIALDYLDFCAHGGVELLRVAAVDADVGVSGEEARDGGFAGLAGGGEDEGSGLTSHGLPPSLHGLTVGGSRHGWAVPEYSASAGRSWSDQALTHLPSFRLPPTPCVFIYPSAGNGDPAIPGIGGVLAATEQVLNKLAIPARYIRAGVFMENLVWYATEAKHTGSFSLPVVGSQKMAFMSAADIGRFASELMLDATWTGQEGVHVPYGESVSNNELAKIFGEVLGRDVVFKTITGDEWKAKVAKHGFSDALADSLVDMYRELDHGSVGGKTQHSGGISVREFTEKVVKPALEK
ncbi:hypothetical protein BDK51DRAFT_41543 [Blyttiomyces helicus]|uniref:NmrA-like domain-containing protein n=1 Tax=Blyttiomyces helicus TaxID=388810 RepID=A0A4V1IQF6_9FUNG|nr:hypothetical protein BDK51DRAFT_41543 [Blyttiomyces helicus]|eukprot:RKO86387.1 hypothetical protein BDK51DRAFT_41543 [Blyttiomyces helicus]